MDKAIRKRRGRSGVPTTFIIVAWTVLSLTDHRPTEAAVFRCSSGDASCLIQSINASNNNNEDNAIFLEAGTYTLTQAKALMKAACPILGEHSVS